MRFIEHLPIIEEVLPVCPDGTDISISYYLFNKWSSSPTPPENVDQLVIGYAYEAAYAYRQLLALTNIEACGRVRFFIDSACEDMMRPYFEKIGLDSLVVIIDVPKDIRLSGYIPQLSHPSVTDCRYRFHCDVDLWWFSNDAHPQRFDWREFCAYMDTANEDTFFGQPIQKHEWIYQINYSGHAFPEDRQTKAQETLRAIFGPKIPDEFQAIYNDSHEVLLEKNELSSLQCFAGWFVGVRDGSTPIWYLNKLYNDYETYLNDDEGLYSLLFYLYPDLNQFKVLQGEGNVVGSQIPQACIFNFEDMQGSGTINIGGHEFSQEREAYDAEIKKLAKIFVGDTYEIPKPIEIELPPAPLGLRTFGQHIVGTYALDVSGKEYPLLTHTQNNHSTMFGFPAAFRPIRKALPAANKENAEIALFYCLFHHPQHASHDMHVYAKSMTYAYKMLLQNTNIQDVGRVYLFVDERAMSLVYPYLKEANIHNCVVPFSSDKQIQYAAYIPCFWHEVMEGIKYRFYMDVDMWWINLFDGDKFDYQHLVNAANNDTPDIYGYLVPKDSDSIAADLYVRSNWDGDSHIENARDWMVANFGQETLTENIRSITGSHNGVRQSETLDKLKAFYEEVNNFIRDDEALWSVFLSKNPDIELKPLEQLVDGTGFHQEEIETHRSAQLSHVGTYMFEHFFNKPHAVTFYDHCE